MMMTIVEGKVKKENWPNLKEAYKLIFRAAESEPEVSIFDVVLNKEVV
ncbi:hypothetical protein HY031_00615 [Candidatus Gottesmanbacteria bacterium]|nr:hypothetical protein [Candidatus Gottesmanbacteria bacterium]